MENMGSSEEWSCDHWLQDGSEDDDNQEKHREHGNPHPPTAVSPGTARSFLKYFLNAPWCTQPHMCLPLVLFLLALGMCLSESMNAPGGQERVCQWVTSTGILPERTGERSLSDSNPTGLGKASIWN